MYRFLLFFIVTFAASFGYSQEKGKVIMTIDGHPTAKEEFVRLYKKNNDQAIDQADKKTPKEYLKLFVNFKLKVLEAERLKYDTVPSFINELKKYRKDLAAPYLTDVQYTNQMVETAYKRMQSEINASHILLRLNKNASPEDTLKAWNKIMDIRKQILDGADFGEMAVKYSQDPSVKNNKGTLGYFSAFQMVYPFENMAYNTAVGEISMPVRTDYGYHLIKINDRRPSRGQIKVAHIMKRLASNASEETINRQKQVIDSIAQLIKNGTDFAKLAKENSDDRNSASKGGELPWFSSAGMMPEFAEPAFALKNNGDISPIIRTPYGWHIIKRLDYRPLGSYDNMKEFLSDKIRRNPNISNHSKEIFISKLKNEYGFELDSSVYNHVMNKIEPAYKKGQLKNSINSDVSDVLFSFANKQVTGKQFVDFLANATEAEQQSDQLPSLPTQFKRFVDQTLTSYEDSHLEEKYPDFKYLLKEYHDGILLFNISEDKIWNAAAQDSAGLQAFYQNSKKKYYWDDPFKGFCIKCKQQKEKDFIDAVFAADPDIEEEELKDQVNKQFGDNDIQITYGYFEKGKDPLVDYLVWNEPKPEDYKEVLNFIHGNKVGKQVKTLDEARGLYLSDYQNFLEENWLKELHKRYKVKVNKRILKSIE